MRTAREIPARTFNSTHKPRAADQSANKPDEIKAKLHSAPLHPSPLSRSLQVPFGEAERSISAPEFQRVRPDDLHFTIWHRFRVPGTDCAPGEEVAAATLSACQRNWHLPLSLTLRLVFDLLARHRHLPLSASQIAASFRADPFYRKHGCNALGGGALVRRVSISSVRTYIQRLRLGMALAFKEAGLQIDSRCVLSSEETVTNEVGYRLRGTFEWVHTDHPGPEFAWVK